MRCQIIVCIYAQPWLSYREREREREYKGWVGSWVGVEGVR